MNFINKCIKEELKDNLSFQSYGWDPLIAHNFSPTFFFLVLVLKKSLENNIVYHNSLKALLFNSS